MGYHHLFHLFLSSCRSTPPVVPPSPSSSSSCPLVLVLLSRLLLPSSSSLSSSAVCGSVLSGVCVCVCPLECQCRVTSTLVARLGSTTGNTQGLPPFLLSKRGSLALADTHTHAHSLSLCLSFGVSAAVDSPETDFSCSLTQPANARRRTVGIGTFAPALRPIRERLFMLRKMFHFPVVPPLRARERESCTR